MIIRYCPPKKSKAAILYEFCGGEVICAAEMPQKACIEGRLHISHRVVRDMCSDLPF